MKNIVNFRDFGGYPTTDGRRLKEGPLYRSGSLDKARNVDLKTLQSLGIKTIIDLRSPGEYIGNPGIPPGARKVTIPFDFNKITRRRLRPFLFRRNTEQKAIDVIDGAYEQMVDQAHAQVRELFRILLLPEVYPVVINCRAGKDRTGFAVAAIQLAVGVEVESVIADYMRSNEFTASFTERTIKRLKRLTLGMLPTENLRILFTVRDRHIHTILSSIQDKYGGIETYLERCGIGPNDLVRLRDLLLE